MPSDSTTGISIVGQRGHRGAAGEGGLDVGGEAFGFGRLPLVFPLLQGGHDLFGKHLQRLADVVVAVAARLLNEHHLVDPDIGIALELSGDLLGRADAQRLPQTPQMTPGIPGSCPTHWSGPAGAGRSRSSATGRGRRTGIPRAPGARPLPRSCVHRQAHHHGDVGDSRCGRWARTHPTGSGSSRPPSGRPRQGSTKAKVSAPMPSRAANLMVSRFEHATHSGGWGFCAGLGTTLRHGMEKYSPSIPRVGLHDHHVAALLGGLGPRWAFVGVLNVESAQLHCGRRLAGAEIHPAVGDEVQGGDALGHPGRVVVLRAASARCHAPALSARCAGWPRPRTPPGPTSGSTPPRSGAPPPRRSRIPVWSASSTCSRASCRRRCSSPGCHGLRQLVLIENAELHASRAYAALLRSADRGGICLASPR